jgi:uncharacterized membrane protein (DUF485 family)
MNYLTSNFRLGLHILGAFANTYLGAEYYTAGRTDGIVLSVILVLYCLFVIYDVLRRRDGRQ